MSTLIFPDSVSFVLVILIYFSYVTITAYPSICTNVSLFFFSFLNFIVNGPSPCDNRAAVLTNLSSPRAN